MHSCYICEKELNPSSLVEETECGEVVCIPCTTDPNDIIIKEIDDSIYYFVNRD